MNDKTEGDKQGKLTFTGGRDECVGSVLDLILEVEREKQCVSRMKILERIESDHLPLEFTFKKTGHAERGTESGEQCEAEDLRKIGEVKLRWDNKKAMEYGNAILKGQQQINEDEKVTWGNIVEKVKEAAKEAGMISKPKMANKKKRGKEWFNEKCRAARKEVRKKGSRSQKRSGKKSKDIQRGSKRGKRRKRRGKKKKN